MVSYYSVDWHAERTKKKKWKWNISCPYEEINRQTLFEDEEDSKIFIQTLQKYREICEYKLFVYCLMGNHVHLLLMEVKQPLETGVETCLNCQIH